VRCVLVRSRSDQDHVRSGEGQVKVRSRSGKKIRSGQGQMCLGQDRSGEVRTKHVMYGQVHTS